MENKNDEGLLTPEQIANMLKDGEIKKLLIEYDAEVEKWTDNNSKDGVLELIKSKKDRYGVANRLNHNKPVLHVVNTKITHSVNCRTGENRIYIDTFNKKGGVENAIYRDLRFPMPDLDRDIIIAKLEGAIALINEYNKEFTIKQSAYQTYEEDKFDENMREDDGINSTEKENKEILKKLQGLTFNTNDNTNNKGNQGRGHGC